MWKAPQSWRNALKTGLKGLYNLGRIGASKAIKSDFAKNKMKGMAKIYLEEALDSVTSDLSRKLDPLRGSGLDVHKWIGKLPRPRSGFTPGQYKYMGPYNPLEKQLKYDPTTGEVLEWYDQPYKKVDEISTYHDICYDMGKNKGDCDRQMVAFSAGNCPVQFGELGNFFIGGDLWFLKMAQNPRFSSTFNNSQS